MARTDNDTWDLASSVGATATMVAAQRALATREGLIDDPFAALLVRAVGISFFIRLLDGDIELADTDQTHDARQVAETMAVRTRFYDGVFTDAAATGVRQAVILAAGLDARGYRLPWPPGTIVYEVDQSDVIEFKSRTLSDCGARPSADVRAVGVDLRADWPKALLDNGFDRSQPTAWIAEGLLIYLPSNAQDLLFDNITALSASGSWLGTEHIPDPGVFADERSQRLSAWTKQQDFNIKMGDLIIADERSNVIDYLTSHGWQVTAQPVRDAYATNGFVFPDDDLVPFRDLSCVTATLGLPKGTVS